MKKHIFWIGSIGYQYNTKDDLLVEIQEHLRNDEYETWEQWEWAKEYDKEYTKEEAKIVKEKFDKDHWWKGSKVGINIYALLTYYEKYGKSVKTIVKTEDNIEIIENKKGQLQFDFGKEN